VPRTFYPALVTAVDARLQAHSYGKVTKALGIWMRPVGPATSAWVGVSAAWYPGGEGSLGVTIKVGIRHDAIETVLRSLWPELVDHTGASAINATVVTNIQSLRQESIRGVVRVNGPAFVEPAAQTIADQIIEYGWPFANSRSTLSGLIDALEKDPFGSAAEYRLPVAHYLDGRPDAAREALGAGRRRVAEMKGPVKEGYEAFARDFFTRIATLPTRAE